MIDILKYSSLLQNGKNYCRKTFYSTGSRGWVHKTFFIVKYQDFPAQYRGLLPSAYHRWRHSQFAKCFLLFNVMLNVIMLRILALSVIASIEAKQYLKLCWMKLLRLVSIVMLRQSIIMLCITMLSIIMVCIVMLSIVILIVFVSLEIKKFCENGKST